MSDIWNWLSQCWQWLSWQLTHMSLAMGLWIGLAILTVVLLILMRTRWGSVAPIWKCVILSVFAHILLGAYAWGTHLIFTVPPRAAAEHFSLTLVDPDVDNQSADEQTTQANPWDELDLSTEASPAAGAAARVATELTPDISRTAPRTDRPVAPPVFQAQVLADVPDRSLPVDAEMLPDRPAATEVRGSVEPRPINFRRQRRDEPTEVTGPTPESARRMDTGPSATASLPVSPPDRGAPRAVDPQQVESLIQNLASGAMSASSLEDPLENSRLPVEPTAQKFDASPSTSPGPATEIPRRLADGKPMPDLYAGRSLEQRQRRAREFGGSPQTEHAVDAALNWLAANQEPAGNWSAARHGAGQEHLILGHDRRGAGAQADTGVTGLALLAFLGAGHSHLEGGHRETVQRGLEFLINHQAADGNLAGQARVFARMYCHAMATLALGEALATTGDRRIRNAVERAVNYSLMSQERTAGGWRYRPGDAGDMSQFGWQVMALKSAQLGGIEIPAEANRLMLGFLQRCSSGSHGGLAAYQPGQRPSASMTAEALLCRHFLQAAVPPATSAEASQLLMHHLPGTAETNFYYWYYGTLALFHAGGPEWDTWNSQLTRTLSDSQQRSGSLAGSWDPAGLWCGYGGRVYSTAIATLCLEVYYRYDRAGMGQ